MPIHEYLCRACGHRFEKLVRNATTATAVACEQCGRCGENRPPCGSGDA